MTRKFSTRAIHAGEGWDRGSGAHNTPIYQTATWITEDGEPEPRYMRMSSSPNHASVAAKIAALEGVEAGLVTASGMAARWVIASSTEATGRTPKRSTRPPTRTADR